MTTFMPPPPAATYLAFHPQDNNIIAIGMEDSTIQIYNVRVDEVNILCHCSRLGCVETDNIILLFGLLIKESDSCIIKIKRTISSF